MTIIFTFPGQSSCYPSMLSKLAAAHPVARARLDEACDLLGEDLRAHYRDDNPNVFAKNRHIQIGVFLANQMHLDVLAEAGVEAVGSLGLSLGEWNHLVHIGAVSFADALRAVDARGRAYDAGPRGIMAAVFPLDLEELEPLIERARAQGVVEAVNLNSPRQNVVAGDEPAVRELMRILEEDTFSRAVVIEEQVPMHCSTFAPVGASFRQTLETLQFNAPALPYLPNRLGDFAASPTQDTFVELLSTHVHMPVLWRKSIDAALSRWPGAVVIEVGPKRVLTGLLDRKWHKGLEKLHTDVDGDVTEHLAGIRGKLQELAA